MQHSPSRSERLQKQLQDWLRRNELDHDLSFWSSSEWRERGEKYLNEAEFVITTAGDLHFLLNYACDHALVDELQDLVSSFGFWFEMGHSWNLGFYEDDADDETTSPTTYRAKLNDRRWTEKARTVRQRAGNRCQDCGATDRRLDVHHCWYKYGLEPWQYPFDALRSVCRECHRAREAEEHDFRCLNAQFARDELRTIREAVKRLFHWYDRSAALEFLDAVGPDGDRMARAVRRLADNKTEPGAS